MTIAVIPSGSALRTRLSYCEAGFALRSLRNMEIVLSHSANDALPAFPSVRPGY